VTFSERKPEEPTRIVLGCGNFGGIGSSPAFFGQGNTEAEAFEIMDAAWAHGIRWFDTADAYGGGNSETFIGRWLADRRPEGLSLNTKVFHSVAGDPGDRGLARDRIRRQLEGSLERLGVERVDLYLAHEPDPDTPIALTVEAFEELVAEGVIGAWGLSNYDAAGLREALAHGTPAQIQNGYSLLDHRDDAELLPLCAEQEIAYVPFGPLSGGWLAGRYRRGEAYPDGSRMATRPEPYQRIVGEHTFEGLELLDAEARADGTDTATLAYAWVLSNPLVAGVVCGPSRTAHLGPAIAALDLPLSADEREHIGSFFE
jgi:aryl-alcohol dehydrogenase-like predicted oxidoreductase